MNNNNTQNASELKPELAQELQQRPKEKQPERLPTEDLHEEARKRAKKQPLVQKIMKAIRRDNRSFRELIINSEGLERRVALLVDGVLEKFEVERRGERSKVGAIYKGKIQNLEPGLKAAFVDVGEEKNAFLHYWDILPAANDASVEIVRENLSSQAKPKLSIKDIPRHYPIGTDIVVQITKSQIGSKGPRTTTNLSIPGRFLVLMPNAGQCGISRKIEDRKERDRLKKIIRKLTLPEGMGIIIRTAGEGKQIRYFIRDLHLLLKKWDAIQEEIDNSTKPTLLYQEPGLIERTIRDFLTEDIDRVLIDNEKDYHGILETVSRISSRSKSKISLYKEHIPIFERFNIERQIEQTFMRKVPLPSGGEIVIEETEALTAIDVNTGSHKVSSKDGKNFIVGANLEAAKEVARQIRLRNIGGLVIIDFIDMKNKRDRKAVYDFMRREMSRDKAKCHVLPISTLGIMQMSRQRHQESTASSIYVGCPYCHGRGTIKSENTMCAQIERKLISVLRHHKLVDKKEVYEKPLSLRVFLHPKVHEKIHAKDENLLIDIEKSFNVNLSFRADPLFHIENFKVINIETSEELS